MAKVKVNVTDVAIISAVNTPGGAVHEWRDQVAEAIVQRARLNSPINDVLNAVHRGGAVGEYLASWETSTVGSNQHRVRAVISNFSDHAVYVEYGRRSTIGSTRPERYSTVGGAFIASTGTFTPPGEIIVSRGTQGFDGQHVLRDAANDVMPLMTGGAYAPLLDFESI